MTEKDLQSRLMLHWSESGMRLFRNQVGSYQLPDGRWLSSGLCIGSSDLIGWTPVIVTPDMVGRPVAVFTAIEVKKPGGHTAKDRAIQQALFLSRVKEAGGLGVIARDVVEDVQAELSKLIGA